MLTTDMPDTPSDRPALPSGLYTWLLHDGGKRSRALLRDFSAAITSAMESSDSSFFKMAFFLKPLSEDDRMQLLIAALDSGAQEQNVVAVMSTFARVPSAEILERLRAAIVRDNPYDAGAVQVALSRTQSLLEIMTEWNISPTHLHEALNRLPSADKGLILYMELARGGPLWPDIFPQPLSGLLHRDIQSGDIHECLVAASIDSAAELAGRLQKLGDRILLTAFAHLPDNAVSRFDEETLMGVARILAHADLDDAMHARARNHLLFHAPLPAELTAHHAEKMLALSDRLKDDPDGMDARRYADAYNNWDHYDDTQQGDFLNFHTAMLAGVYNAPFTPPVTMVDHIPSRKGTDIMGMQTGPRNEKAIYENAFGATSLVRRHVRPDFKSAVGMDTHEFTHGWENWMCARLFLRESGRLKKQAASQFPIIVRDTWERDCALLFAFNQQSSSPLTRRGHYFDVGDSNPNYASQIRERHAQFVQGLYENDFMETIRALAQRHAPAQPANMRRSQGGGEQPGTSA